jgi:hypothetical protein
MIINLVYWRIIHMNRVSVVRSLCLVLTLALLAGCTGGPIPDTTAPLSANDLNLIFVISPDLTYNAPGDINPDTANLTNQGLQRSLLMATYLKQQVLGGKNVNRIYALEPMTHLQTANKYPDMAAIGYIQQFAVLNQISLTSEGGYGSPFITSNSYPINASYSSEPLPNGVITPSVACPGCQGLDFNDRGGDNEALVNYLLEIKFPGFYVFSAPWETVSTLMANINKNRDYKLSLPAAYSGPNTVYAISVTPSGSASLVTYNSNLNPPPTYPELPSPVASSPCSAQKPFSITATGGVNDAVIPPGTNTNETLYMVRHAEAHPANGWDDGNYVAAGQWRALALPNAIRGKISPTEVYSIDPAQVYPGSLIFPGNSDFSYVRPSLTVEPYAIANNLPFYLVSEFNLTDPNSPKYTSDMFFSGGAFSNKTILLAWEHDHFPPIITALLASYFPGNKIPKVPAWPDSDYDTIWTVTLDATGNLTVNNALCEGIDSTKLPVTAPQFIPSLPKG